ncbi:hypothetical protein HPB52_023155 [Rhipicephalus sanguineus]|uniref:Phospholipase A2-like central domain-containing protein n=1 Tax=Rhipicephalus sanguineus TaxID=34632 RepID=A0A9D4PXX8_RHISA|nr:hypothetical protein HPB52_023155 [Rhipicephalus sanguineus]
MESSKWRKPKSGQRQWYELLPRATPQKLVGEAGRQAAPGGEMGPGPRARSGATFSLHRDDCDWLLPLWFRSCLKMANNGASHMVGKLYFNVVQTKCFVFKYHEVCELRSWWGQCLRREKQKVAVLRSGMTY